jgi:hypothetical protein
MMPASPGFCYLRLRLVGMMKACNLLPYALLVCRAAEPASHSAAQGGALLNGGRPAWLDRLFRYSQHIRTPPTDTGPSLDHRAADRHAF